MSVFVWSVCLFRLGRVDGWTDSFPFLLSTCVTLVGSTAVDCSHRLHQDSTIDNSNNSQRHRRRQRSRSFFSAPCSSSSSKRTTTTTRISLQSSPCVPSLLCASQAFWFSPLDTVSVSMCVSVCVCWCVMGKGINECARQIGLGNPCKTDGRIHPGGKPLIIRATTPEGNDTTNQGAEKPTLVPFSTHPTAIVAVDRRVVACHYTARDDTRRQCIVFERIGSCCIVLYRIGIRTNH